MDIFNLIEILLVIGIGLLGYMLWTWIFRTCKLFYNKWKYRHELLSVIHIGKTTYHGEKELYRMAIETIDDPEIFATPDRNPQSSTLYEFMFNNFDETYKFIESIDWGNCELSNVMGPSVPKDNKDIPLKKWMESRINYGYKIIFLKNYIIINYITKEDTKVNIINKDREEFFSILKSLPFAELKNEAIMGFKRSKDEA